MTTIVVDIDEDEPVTVVESPAKRRATILNKASLTVAPIIVLPLSESGGRVLESPVSNEQRLLRRMRALATLQEITTLNGVHTPSLSAILPPLDSMSLVFQRFAVASFGRIDDWKLNEYDASMVTATKAQLEVAPPGDDFMQLMGQDALKNRHISSLLQPNTCLISDVMTNYMLLLDRLHGSNETMFGSLAHLSDPREWSAPNARAIQRLASSERYPEGWLARFALPMPVVANQPPWNAWVTIHLEVPSKHYTLLRLKKHSDRRIFVYAYDSWPDTAQKRPAEVYGKMLAELVKTALPSHTLIYELRSKTIHAQEDDNSCGLFALLVAREFASAATRNATNFDAVQAYRDVLFTELMRQRVPLYRTEPQPLPRRQQTPP